MKSIINKITIILILVLLLFINVIKSNGNDPGDLNLNWALIPVIV